jgi:UDP-N-acetyl-D-glucosamine dehydrogenase
MAKISDLVAGRSYIKHIPASDVADMLTAGFRPSADFAIDLPKCDVIVICVPTPLDKMREPDLSFVEATVSTIAKTLRHGQLIALESTTYPGTTREVVLPILEATGLKAGTDFLLAFSPEREDPGNPRYTVNNIPKVVGGLDPESLKVASAFYAALTTGGVVKVSSCEVAEATKIVENIYRCVNIALVNELKVLFDRMGINIHEVLDAAATKPFGFQKFLPGPGLGGHCIPIDPFYLSWKARQYEMSTRFIELAGEVNLAMPAYVVQKVIVALNAHKQAVNGAKVLILGLAYKPNVDDVRESPSFKLIELLKELGADVSYHDPYCSSTHPMREHNLGMVSVPNETLYDDLDMYDCVVVATNHDWYDWHRIAVSSNLIVDSRNAIPDGSRNVVRA